MNFADARATLNKMTKGEYRSLTVTEWPAKLDMKPEYKIYTHGHGSHEGKSWKEAFDKLREEMLGNEG